MQKRYLVHIRDQAHEREPDPRGPHLSVVRPRALDGSEIRIINRNRNGGHAIPLRFESETTKLERITRQIVGVELGNTGGPGRQPPGPNGTKHASQRVKGPLLGIAKTIRNPVDN